MTPRVSRFVTVGAIGFVLQLGALDAVDADCRLAV